MDEVEEKPSESEIIDLKFRHVLVPSLFGLILGASAHSLSSTAFVMQFALGGAILSSPLIALLTKTKVGWEHSLGVTVVCGFEAVLWFLGFNYFNTLAVFIIWVWMCASWWKLPLPPFRYGFWHGFTISFTTLIGGIIAFNLH